MMHPLARLISGMGKFVEATTENFADLLPAFMVWAYAYGVSFAEFVLGAALLIGFKTRTTLLLLSAVMGSLIFGMSLLQQWSVVGTQMIYVLLIFILLFFAKHNRLAVDKR